LLSIAEDTLTVFCVAFLFLALALRCLGVENGWAWAGFWGCLGGVVIASGAMLRIGPGAIAKVIKQRAEQLARGGQ
jgi:hypothetical protein